MTKQTLGQELLAAVKEALQSKKPGKIVRAPVNVIAVRK